MHKKNFYILGDIRTKISPPWITFVSKLNALFCNDSQVKIEYNNDAHTVKLYVDSTKKAAALDYLLPDIAEFGNVPLQITVIPANPDEHFDPTKNLAETFMAAFEGNPVFAFSERIEGMFAFDMTYVVFKNRVVQFFADNLDDVHGNISTLYQDIAKDVFRSELAVAYCTDVEEKVGMPLGKWP